MRAADSTTAPRDASPKTETLSAKPNAQSAKHIARDAPPADETPLGENIVDDWSTLVQASGIRGAVRNLAEHCELASLAGNRLELVLSAAKSDFNTDQLRTRLEQALSDHLDRRITLKITVGKPPRATPAEVRRANENERMRRTREAIEQDPNIRAVQEAFDAVLEPDSIQPPRAQGVQPGRGQP